jgi:hypothetical protein
MKGLQDINIEKALDSESEYRLMITYNRMAGCIRCMLDPNYAFIRIGIREKK